MIEESQEDKDIRYMRIALQAAEEAYKQDEVPVGAIIVYKDKVIAKAHNMTEKLTDFTAHAEMQAFTMAADALRNKYLDLCTLYVTLEPCVMCAGAAFWTRIGRVVYAAKDEKRGFLKHGNLLHPKANITGGILEDEASELVVSFFKHKRK